METSTGHEIQSSPSALRAGVPEKGEFACGGIGWVGLTFEAPLCVPVWTRARRLACAPPLSTCRLRRRCDPLWWVLKGGTWQPERVLGAGPDAEGGPTTARRLREHGPISDSEPDGHGEDSSEQAGHWRPMVYDTIHVPR